MPAKSVAQQQVMGIARAIQKNKMKAKPGTPSAEIAKSMKPSDVDEFAGASQAGLPKKKKMRVMDVTKMRWPGAKRKKA